ncbi:hypothetical protein RND81_14G251000 [Saponaria officinalis]|uniref:Knottins-like domain-containing protein n=1 Tax=Saponaria officinalis TaxID=3572 RepID=A0AAW1GTM5_SAPOF
MAKSVFGVPTTFVVIMFAFLLMNAALEKGMIEGLCEKRSQTWTGACVVTGNCSKQCKNLEGAKFGACHFQFPGFACFCYYDSC